MKVLMLCLSRGHGGLELYTLREVMALRERGHECVPVISRNSLLDQQMQAEGLDRKYLHVWNKRLPILAARSLARLIDREKADIIHLHWNKDLNLGVLAKEFSARNIRLMYSRHMEITRSKRDIFHRWFYKRVDRLTVTTKLMKQAAEKYLPLRKEKIKLLYLGVAAPKSETIDCSAFFKHEHFPKRNLNLALFGRIEPYKGQHILVSALAMLAKENMDISVTIVGHVMDKQYFERLQDDIRESGISEYIQFKEFINDPVELMGCFDAIVLTTYCETFGLVLVEAMRSGVAAIGTDAGGVPEIIEHGVTGFLVEPGQTRALAGLIGQIYEDRELLNKIAKQGKEKADAMFSEERHFSELEENLCELLV